MQYSPSYHKAIHHLVVHGGHGGDTQHGRDLIARALHALRAKHGAERARQERRHMLFISGMFPLKVPREPDFDGGDSDHWDCDNGWVIA